MKRTPENLIDLGVASTETKGYSGFVDDTKGGQIPATGLDDE